MGVGFLWCNDEQVGIVGYDVEQYGIEYVVYVYLVIVGCVIWMWIIGVGYQKFVYWLVIVGNDDKMIGRGVVQVVGNIDWVIFLCCLVEES